MVHRIFYLIRWLTYLAAFNSRMVSRNVAAVSKSNALPHPSFLFQVSLINQLFLVLINLHMIYPIEPLFHLYQLFWK